MLIYTICMQDTYAQGTWCFKCLSQYHHVFTSEELLKWVYENNRLGNNLTAKQAVHMSHNSPRLCCLLAKIFIFVFNSFYFTQGANLSLLQLPKAKSHRAIFYPFISPFCFSACHFKVRYLNLTAIHLWHSESTRAQNIIKITCSRKYSKQICLKIWSEICPISEIYVKLNRCGFYLFVCLFLTRTASLQCGVLLFWGFWSLV